MRFVFPILLLAAGAVNAQPAPFPPVERPMPFPPVEARMDDNARFIKARDLAADKGVPLVVCIGMDPVEVPGAVNLHVASMDGVPGQTVLFSVPTPNGRAYYRLRGGNVWTVADIQEEIRLRTPSREVSRAASFFDRLLRRGEVRRTVDDRADPQLAGLLDGLEPYQTATMTQHTGRRISGVISPTPKTTLENKWNVPGHLDGVQGWSSSLYKTRGVQANVFLVAQDPNDSVSAITWGRAYPDVRFVDVLRNSLGEVFEVRVAEKDGGKWDRFVAFSAPHARPAGYVRPTSKQCRECHNQAGASAYDAGAIPGADTILSDPFPNLEAGQSVQGGNRTRL